MCASLLQSRETNVIKAVEGGSSNVASSLAYIQLEKQNARLKEALVRFEISRYIANT